MTFVSANLVAPGATVALSPISTTSAPGAEIVSFDTATNTLFTTASGSINGFTLGSDGTLVDAGISFDFDEIATVVPGFSPGGANSVTASGGLVAAAVEASESDANGAVAFFMADGTFVTAVEVGVLPDAVAFSADGSTLISSNEGEFDIENVVFSEDGTTVTGDIVDPAGSISVIDTSDFSVTTLTFDGVPIEGDNVRIRDGVQGSDEGVTLTEDPSVPDGVNINDLEPELAAFSPDGTQAFVTLQENNAVAILDLTGDTPVITSVQGLGTVDNSIPGNGFDGSSDDGAINITTQPTTSLRQPDTIASFAVGGEAFFIIANEGDGRDPEEENPVTGEDVLLFSDFMDLEDVTLDPTAFPDAADLQSDSGIGPLEVSIIDGDTDGDGDLDEIFPLGSRSFSILDSTGAVVFDSGDDFEQITAQALPAFFNTDDEEDAFDDRSDDSGPEPEGVAVGTVDGSTFAFITPERPGGVFVYDVTDPENATFVQYINTRNFSPEGQEDPIDIAGDSSPEGSAFIPADSSPTGTPLLAVAFEVSETITLFELGAPPAPFGSTPDVLPTDGLFAEQFYLDSNPDVAEAVADGTFASGLEHFTEFGAAEGRATPIPNLDIVFDPVFYATNNPDAVAEVEAGLFPTLTAQFLLAGADEGLDPSAGFSGSAYLADNADVAAAVDAGIFDSAVEHYLLFGINEGRDPFPDLIG